MPGRQASAPGDSPTVSLTGRVCARAYVCAILFKNIIMHVQEIIHFDFAEHVEFPILRLRPPAKT